MSQHAPAGAGGLISLAFFTAWLDDLTMIAVATNNAASGHTLFNWFDIALVLLVGFGFWRGRKNGMTKEFLPVSQWLVIVFAGGLGNELLGGLFIQWGVIRNVIGKSFTEKTAAYITSYLLIALVVWILFIYLGRYLKPKLEGSNIFGAGEYYLGIVSGIIRYVCIMIFALALLNAPFYTPAEITAQAAYNHRVYGGNAEGFSGDFIPSVSELQTSIFKNSLLGPFIHDRLGVMLINTVAASAPAPKPVMSFQ